MKAKEITKEMMERYERVRFSGLYNMLDPRARRLVGVDEKTYSEMVFNYGSLMGKLKVKRLD